MDVTRAARPSVRRSVVVTLLLAPWVVLAAYLAGYAVVRARFMPGDVWTPPNTWWVAGSRGATLSLCRWFTPCFALERTLSGRRSMIFAEWPGWAHGRLLEASWRGWRDFAW